MADFATLANNVNSAHAAHQKAVAAAAPAQALLTAVTSSLADLNRAQAAFDQEVANFRTSLSSDTGTAWGKK